MTCFYCTQNKDDCPYFHTILPSCSMRKCDTCCSCKKSVHYRKQCLGPCEHFLDTNPPDVTPIAGCLGSFIFGLIIVASLWYLILCGMGIL